MNTDDCQQNEDGSWGPAKAIGYFWDSRPIWLKLLEFPFRLFGLIRYDPLREVPYDELDFSKHKSDL
jgi:hypothetical protein